MSAPVTDSLVVVLIAAGCSLAMALFGVLLLRMVPRRSLVLSSTVVALIGVGGTLSAALVSARAMFFSSHDFQVLVIVCIVAGAVSVATAIVLARAVVAGSRALGVAAASLVDGSYTPATSSPTSDLADLDRKLADTSARLETSRARERSLEESRRELVAWVSHDLRTPLAGIRAMAEALEDGVVDGPETVARYHVGLRQEADRLAAMVDDLFELSRINASAVRLKVQEISVADVVSDAVASARPVARAKGVRLVGETDGWPLTVAASEPELGRVLRNLLSNAIRHTPADGVVSVMAASDDSWVFIEIADACGGIPDEDLPRVFDVAFRGTSARTPGEDGGAGLGLAIARGLVEAHHGQITIDNEGLGCRARVALPLS